MSEATGGSTVRQRLWAHRGQLGLGGVSLENEQDPVTNGVYVKESEEKVTGGLWTVTPKFPIWETEWPSVLFVKTENCGS